MDESDFHDRVAQGGEIDDPEPITEATLETLGEALSSGQAADVAEYLPETYATTLTDASETAGGADSDGGAGDGAESISRSAFVERVRDRAADYAGGGILDETDELRPRVEAVTEALQEAIPTRSSAAFARSFPTTSNRCSPAARAAGGAAGSCPVRTRRHAERPASSFARAVGSPSLYLRAQPRSRSL